MKLFTNNELAGKSLFITGKPASGKTTFANRLSLWYPDHVLIHTDNYINNLYDLKKLITGLNKQNKCYMLEGNMADVLIPELNPGDHPDMIIDLFAYDSEIKEVYQKERNNDKYKIALDFFYHRRKKLEAYFKKLETEIYLLKLDKNVLYD